MPPRHGGKHSRVRPNSKDLNGSACEAKVFFYGLAWQRSGSWSSGWLPGRCETGNFLPGLASIGLR
jgi:hypothetical protein